MELKAWMKRAFLKLMEGLPSLLWRIKEGKSSKTMGSGEKAGLRGVGNT